MAAEAVNTVPGINSEWPSLEAFRSAAQAGAKAEGFAFSTRDSNLKDYRGKHKFLTLQCTKGRHWFNSHGLKEEARKRRRLTKREGCPVALRVVEQKRGNDFVWVVNQYIATHNHQLLFPTQIHSLPQHRSLNSDHVTLYRKMTLSGSSTCSIATAINLSGGLCLPKDVRNLRARLRVALNVSYLLQSISRVICCH